MVTLVLPFGTSFTFAGDDFLGLRRLCADAGTGVPPVPARLVCDVRSSSVSFVTLSLFAEAGAGAGVVCPLPAAAAFRMPRLDMLVRQQGVCAWVAPWSSGREERHGVSK